MIASSFARNDKLKSNHTDVKKRKSLEIDNAYYPEFDTEIFILEQTSSFDKIVSLSYLILQYTIKNKLKIIGATSPGNRTSKSPIMTHIS